MFSDIMAGCLETTILLAHTINPVNDMPWFMGIFMAEVVGPFLIWAWYHSNASKLAGKCYIANHWIVYLNYYKAAVGILSMSQSDTDHFKAILEIDLESIQTCLVGQYGPEWYAEEGSMEWNTSLEDSIQTFKQGVSGLSIFRCKIEVLHK